MSRFSATSNPNGERPSAQGALMRIFIAMGLTVALGLACFLPHLPAFNPIGDGETIGFTVPVGPDGSIAALVHLETGTLAPVRVGDEELLIGIPIESIPNSIFYAVVEFRTVDGTTLDMVPYVCELLPDETLLQYQQ